MERNAMSFLKEWKRKSGRKPLIIKGARQVGKTWLMKEFGKREYDQVAYINFERSKSLQDLFVSDYNTDRIIASVQIACGLKINVANTLIVFDEIQEAEGGLTSLKYFCEDAPEYHIIAAGSLLGISLHRGSSFPVGKVDFLDLYPFSFSEFLKATGQEQLLDLIENSKWDLIKQFKETFQSLLRQYYYVGGMPEVVASFIESGDYNEVRDIQRRILLAYEQDFSKYAPSEIVPRIRMLWNAIPSQLAKENRKFIYGAVKKGSRAKDFELALAWLLDCGLVYQVNRISKPGFPLKSYVDMGAFKLFMLDVGLLGAMTNINATILLEGSAIFEEFKGSITEQYVLQQIETVDKFDVYYWSSGNSTGEVDFVIQYDDKIYAVEVKAEENLQAKSLKYFKQKFAEVTAIRISMSDYRKEDWLTNLPLYAVDSMCII